MPIGATKETPAASSPPESSSPPDPKEGKTAQSTIEPTTLPIEKIPEPYQWMEEHKVPAEYRNNPALSPYKGKDGFNNFVKSHIEQQKQLGVDKIPAPQKSWGAEQWKEFNSKIGCPKSPDQYPKIDPELPVGRVVDKSLQDEFLELFHKIGLRKSQAKDLQEFFWNKELANLANFEGVQNKALEETAASLRSEWGEDYTGKIDLIKASISKYGGEELLKKFFDRSDARFDPNVPTYRNDPDLLRYISRVQDMLSEDNEEMVKSLNMSKEALSARTRERIKNDPALWKALKDARDPMHKEVLQQWDDSFLFS